MKKTFIFLFVFLLMLPLIPCTKAADAAQYSTPIDPFVYQQMLGNCLLYTSPSPRD